MESSATMASSESRPEGELAPEDLDILSRVATWVVDRRMTVPAILFLESHRPLSFVGSQVMIAASPVVATLEPFFRGLIGKTFTYADQRRYADYRRFAELMENRENLEALIVEVERANQRQKDLDRAEKDKRKALKRELREKKRALRRARRGL